jgi:hypothetical protein
MLGDEAYAAQMILNKMLSKAPIHVELRKKEAMLLDIAATNRFISTVERRETRSTLYIAPCTTSVKCNLTPSKDTSSTRS